MNRIKRLMIVWMFLATNVIAQEMTSGRIKEVNRAISNYESALRLKSKDAKKERLKAKEDILKLGKDAIPMLTKIIKDKSKDNQLRHKAMQIAIKSKDENVAIPLLEVSNDKSDEWYHRVEAIRNIGKLNDELQKVNKGLDKKYLTDLEKLFNDEENHFDIREEAIFSYGKIGQNEALPTLLKKLNDPNKKIQTSTVYGIGMVRTKEGDEALLQGYLRARGTFLEGTYIRLLGLHKNKNAVPYLIESLKMSKGNSKKSISKRRSIMKTLGDIKDNRAIHILIDLTESKDILEAARAAASLCEIGDIRAKKSIEAVMKRAKDSGSDWLLEGKPYSRDYYALRERYKNLINNK